MLTRIVKTRRSWSCQLAAGTRLLLLALMVSAASAETKHNGTPPDASPRSALVGRTVRFDQIVLDAPRREVRPISEKTPVIVRIVEVYPHGSAFRYVIQAVAFEPGEYDLLDFLQPVDSNQADGTARPEVSPLRMKIASSLPDGQVQPHALAQGRSIRLGGYRWVVLLAGLLWGLGLIALLWSGRKKPSTTPVEDQTTWTPTDRLRARVREALDGELAPEQHAELERLLVNHWRERLGLADSDPADALVTLHRHPQAGPLLRNLEQWLHCPDHPETVDVAQMLTPYLNVSDAPEAMDESSAAMAGGAATNQADRAGSQESNQP